MVAIETLAQAVFACGLTGVQMLEPTAKKKS
jgi:hypothetical protein